MEIGIYTFARADPPTRSLARAAPRGPASRRSSSPTRSGSTSSASASTTAPTSPCRAPAVVLGAAAGRTRAHPADQRGDRAQLRRPRPRLPGVRHPGPAPRRPRGDHGRARLVHRVLPALRLRPRRLRRAVRREARAAAAAPRVRARDAGRGRHRAPLDDLRRLPAPRAGPAAGLGRGRRQPAVGGPRRRARPADGPGDHRRHARALRARSPSCTAEAAEEAGHAAPRDSINSHGFIAETSQAARPTRPTRPSPR